ncbi:MAG: hypothetical protein JWO11_797 [Nocardioides sp.]|nr:hypothetical protein [Nocardioides sp.]
MSRIAVAKPLSAPDEWDRRKLQILMWVAVFMVAAVVLGIVWSIQLLMSGGHHTAGAAPGSSDGGVDTVGVPGADLAAAEPGPLSAAETGTLVMPQARSLGEAQVATGFPRTPEGALAQLVAIDRRALESVSVVTAQDVITVWAAAGGPTAESWSGVQAMAMLLSAAGLPADGATEIQVELRPAMGLIRESSAGGVIACVDFVLTVTPGTAQPSRIAVADCQRMVWQSRLWLIGPGTEPEGGPSLWPGTQASYDAGYQWLEVSP